jgi:hypothetical protein
MTLGHLDMNSSGSNMTMDVGGKEVAGGGGGAGGDFFS